MEWLVTDRALVVKVACAPLMLVVASELVPSLKVTFPVGVPLPGETGLTVAVNVTDCPNTDGLADEETVVVVLPGVTVSVPESVAVKLPEGAWTAALPVAWAVKVALLLSPAATRSPLTTWPVTLTSDHESAAALAR